MSTNRATMVTGRGGDVASAGRAGEPTRTVESGAWLRWVLVAALVAAVAIVAVTAVRSAHRRDAELVPAVAGTQAWIQTHGSEWTWMRGHRDEMAAQQHWGDSTWMRQHLADRPWVAPIRRR